MNDITTLPRTSTARRPRTWLRLLVVLLFVGLVAGLMYEFQQFKGNILRQVTANIRSQVPTVATAVATNQQWQETQTATGTARASMGADMAAEVPGVVDKIEFNSGAMVEAGAVLLRLRANDDAAKLAQLEANAELANVTLQRDLKQWAAHGVAQATVDTDQSNVKVTQAQVAAQRALMDEKIVRAPFSGKLGVRQVDLGQYIAAGTPIVTLQRLDPMLVDFWLPQQASSHLTVGAPATVTTDAWPDRPFPGQIQAVNSRVDPISRMLQVRVTVPNADGALLPGMFVNVSISMGPPRPLVTIPNAAVAYNPYGSLVYVVREDTDAQGHQVRVANQQFVTTGAARGDQVSILKGLAANDVVVTAGQLKLHNGSPVNVDNSVRLSDNPSPRPEDR